MEPVNALRRLAALGQSVWLDGPGPDLIRMGQLSRFVEVDGIAGVTIDLANRKQPASDDVQDAADVLAPVYEATDAQDGYVSLAVSPHVAHDTDAALAEARTLWATLARPNAMIAVPATVAGLPAIRDLIADGINVNATLIFGLRRYRQVAEAYLQGLTRRALRGLSLDRVASVASFCVSPIDALIDPRLEAMVAMGSDKAARLVGQVAVASAQLAWKRYCEVFGGDAFAGLARHGARPQRLLWAGTRATKPHPDLKYVEPLVGAGAVIALAPQTIEVLRHQGHVAPRLHENLDETLATLAHLTSLGIDLGAVVAQLEASGLQKRVAACDAIACRAEAQQTAIST
jgi:transaldolase